MKLRGRFYGKTPQEVPGKKKGRKSGPELSNKRRKVTKIFNA